MATYTESQKIMMTLAALAATGATPRPSGESRENQEERIAAGIHYWLGRPNLATSFARWDAPWVELTENRANLAYVARATNATSTCYLVLRGTVMGDPIDQAEDMNVGELMPFAADGSLGNISQGAMEAFTSIVMGTGLLAKLKELKPVQLFVIGHSLGGAMATTVALFLKQYAPSHVPSLTSILPFTFAAPTAGDQEFAKRFNSQFGDDAVCTYNKYDLIPQAWQSLNDRVKQEIKLPDDYYPFYPVPEKDPSDPGPTTAEWNNPMGKLINGVAAKTKPGTYFQPKRQEPPLNHDFSKSESYGVITDPMKQFLMQVAYQHQSNTYLDLLKAPTIDSLVPAVASVQVNSDGTVTIHKTPSGPKFTPECVVDFGIVKAKLQTVIGGGLSIIATPPDIGFGTVDVRVTNNFGTSAIVSEPNLLGHSDRFTFK